MYTVCMYVCVYARRDGVRWFVSLYTLQCEHSPRIGWKVHKQDYDQLVNPHFKTVLSSRTVALQIDIERKRLYTYTFCWQMKNFERFVFNFIRVLGILFYLGRPLDWGATILDTQAKAYVHAQNTRWTRLWRHTYLRTYVCSYLCWCRMVERFGHAGGEQVGKV